MAPNDLEEQVVKYLTDAHSIELQALEQMKRAPALAGDPWISDHFSQHLVETEEHERLVGGRLEALGSSSSTIKDLAGRVTGVGFALFAKANPDTPGKLVAHAFSYEHIELATHELLARVADRAGDADTAALARQIEEQERAMAQRLQASFDRAVDASLADTSPEEVAEQLDKYLSDAHAIEAQAITLLGKAPKLIRSGQLPTVYEQHLEETREHQRLVEERLSARGAGPSRLKDAALAMGALNWGGFFAAQPDTPAKLAGFSYAFEHLEIASYELLARVARRAGDSDTDAMARRIVHEERTAAERIHSLFAEALEEAMEAQGVATK